MNHLGRTQQVLSVMDMDQVISNWTSIKKMCRDKDYTCEFKKRFFIKLHQSKFPLFEKKMSKIKCGGNGVYVTRWYPYAPIGCYLPFYGKVTGTPSKDMDCIYISEALRLELVQFEEPTVHLGNFVNNSLSSRWTPDEVTDQLWTPSARQDYRVLNARLIGQYYPSTHDHTYRMETTLNVPYGYEVLGPYGTKYRAGHRLADWPEAKGHDWTKEEWEAYTAVMQWPEMPSRT